jgi:competence protein ComFC
MKGLLFSVLDFILPLDCIFCGKHDILSSKASICKDCASSEKLKLPFLCNVCKSVLVEDKCNYCSSRNVFFERLEFIKSRTKLEKEIIQKLKFSPKPQLTNYFRIGLKQTLAEINNIKFDRLTSIPSNTKTRRARPFQSSHSIIDFIEKRKKIPYIESMKKISTELQSGKSFRERFAHARFALTILPEFENKLSGNYLLIDDLFTTGATINEGARILLQNGAEKVYALVLCKGF